MSEAPWVTDRFSTDPTGLPEARPPEVVEHQDRGSSVSDVQDRAHER